MWGFFFIVVFGLLLKSAGIHTSGLFETIVVVEFQKITSSVLGSSGPNYADTCTDIARLVVRCTPGRAAGVGASRGRVRIWGGDLGR